MDDWTRERAIEWFRQHAHEPIRLRERGTAFLVRGTAEGLEELDACATEFVDVRLVTGLPQVSVHVSFHADALVLHVLGRNTAAGPVNLSLTRRVPYGQLLLGDAAPEAAEDAEEPFFSPYELLR